MTIFYTADTHFGHEDIIDYCSRPFDDVEEMDGKLIKNWNERVAPDDTVYFVGDFSWYNNRVSNAALLAKLHGRKTLVIGNHDHRHTFNCGEWDATALYLSIKDQGYRIILFHYPIEEWDGKHNGSLHFHGHSHGTCSPQAGRYDVGVDCWNMQPVTLEEILASTVS